MTRSPEPAIRSTFTPIAESISAMIETSVISGTPDRTWRPSQRRQAAMSFRAEFLAPPARTVPFRGPLGRTTNRSSSGVSITTPASMTAATHAGGALRERSSLIVTRGPLAGTLHSEHARACRGCRRVVDDSQHVRGSGRSLRVRVAPVTPEKSAPDRNLAMELVRTTEAAALAAARWMGRGEKEGADAAAVDAMRVVLQTVQMDGIVVIGEGEKDRAPMLFNGEQIGDGSPPETDIAVDPIEGTTLTAQGRGGALAVIAVSERGTMFDPGPCVYMEKLAVGPRAAGSVDITQTPTENIEGVAKALGKSVRDVTVVVLERDRHNDLIAEVRE